MIARAARSARPPRGRAAPSLAIILAVIVALAWPSFTRADEALDARLKALETQLRCLVCQNQTLAESEAPLAEDLRREVRELARSGKSDDDIRAYLVARYGDFVLYKPPVKPVTYLLWFGPFLLLGGGLVVWWSVLRDRARTQADTDARRPETMSETELVRARALLDDDAESTGS